MKRYQSSSKQFRREAGSTLILVLVLACFLVVPLLVILTQMGLKTVDAARIQNTVEAAGLLAANDLSRIVINDPHFGYVSLSNYPPIGKATCAPDGEPLPVISINTLAGTIRQNSVIARELGNDTMTELADDDCAWLESTARALKFTLADSLSKNTKSDWCDLHGKKVETFKDVTAFLNANLPNNMKLESLTLSNGWLTNRGKSTFAVAQPEWIAQIKPGDYRSGALKKYMDIPTLNSSFSFVDAGTSSILVPPSAFQQADNKHICPIVKIECTVSPKNPGAIVMGINSATKLQCVACCQPYSLPDLGPAGLLTIRFSGGPVPGLQSWNDFLRSDHFHDHAITTYDAVGGDYPLDRDARMRQLKTVSPPTTSQQFAEHLYYWLRNGHMHPRIDSVLDMVNEPFRSGANEIYAYEFAKDGTVNVDTSV